MLKDAEAVILARALSDGCGTAAPIEGDDVKIAGVKLRDRADQTDMADALASVRGLVLPDERHLTDASDAHVPADGRMRSSQLEPGQAVG